MTDIRSAPHQRRTTRLRIQASTVDAVTGRASNVTLICRISGKSVGRKIDQMSRWRGVRELNRVRAMRPVKPTFEPVTLTAGYKVAQLSAQPYSAAVPKNELAELRASCTGK